MLSGGVGDSATTATSQNLAIVVMSNLRELIAQECRDVVFDRGSGIR